MILGTVVKLRPAHEWINFHFINARLADTVCAVKFTVPTRTSGIGSALQYLKVLISIDAGSGSGRD
jgi:hypothetical protein